MRFEHTPSGLEKAIEGTRRDKTAETEEPSEESACQTHPQEELPKLDYTTLFDYLGNMKETEPVVYDIVSDDLPGKHEEKSFDHSTIEQIIIARKFDRLLGTNNENGVSVRHREIWAMLSKMSMYFAQSIVIYSLL